jgi:hypothetical protein
LNADKQAALEEPILALIGLGEVSMPLFRGAKNLAAIEAVGCNILWPYLEQQNPFLVK